MIVVGGPIRQRAWCVREHVLAIDRAAVEAKADIHYCYVVGDSTDDTTLALIDAINETSRGYTIIRRSDPSGERYCRDTPQHPLHNLTQARQLWVDAALPIINTRWLWSVDSDIVVGSLCLDELLDANVHMAGARVNLSEHNPNVYNTMMDWRDNQPYRTGHEYRHVDSLWVPATWVGACVLYKREVFTKLGCEYYNDDIESTNPLRMEELAIVRQLRSHGMCPYWVPAARTTHLMTAPA